MKRFDVYLINLDLTKGKEIKKTRPCMIISPDEMNEYISTVIVAPMTSRIRNYPSRITCTFRGTKGQIVLDQISTVDKGRLIKKLGVIDDQSQYEVIQILQEMFSF
jgi:mRNA interferase MazF